MNNDKELVDLAQKVDKILKEELTKAGIEHDLARVSIYDIKTVGVQGDYRTYSYPAEIELIRKGEFVWQPEFIRNLSSRITNEVRGINRVLYFIDGNEVE